MNTISTPPTDTFLIKDGIILRQTITPVVEPKAKKSGQE